MAPPAVPARADDLHEDEVLGRAFDARMVRRLLPFARPHRREFALGVAALFGLFGLELAAPYLLRLAIDGPVAVALATGETRPQVPGLLRYAALFAAVGLAAGWLRYLETVAMNRAGQGVVRDLRVALFAHLQRLPLAFYDRNPVGRLVTRTTSDVEAVAELFTSGVVMALYDTTKIVGAAVVLFLIDARLAAITLALSPLVVVVSLWFRKRARASYREVRGALARLNAYLQEVVGGIRVVQMFGQEPKVRRKFGALADGYLRANLRAVFYFGLFFPLIDQAVAIVWGSVLWVGGGDVIARTLTMGAFLQFWLNLELFFGPIREIGEKYNVLQAAMASAERIFRILDGKPTIASPPSPKRPVASRGAVEFREVSFAYDGTLPVLRRVSFAVEPGETVAIVGATGAGKTTLASLLCRFYDPTEGAVLVDGVDLREWDLGTLRSRLGLVLQDVFLFAGDVLENLTLGRPGVTEERAIAAAGAVQAAAFLERLPGGLRASVAERGVTFSAGERQLLALARALAGDPAIVVLDEATANVDTETERRIQEGVRSLLRDRTSIVIAHRLSTVRSADRILVLHRGELREEGTHAALLRRGGLYARLYRLQFGSIDRG